MKVREATPRGSGLHVRAVPDRWKPEAVTDRAPPTGEPHPLTKAGTDVGETP